MDDPRTGSKAANWLYAIWVTALGLFWTIIWTRLAIRNHDILITNAHRSGEGSSWFLHPWVMWLFVLLGALITVFGVINICRLTAR